MSKQINTSNLTSKALPILSDEEAKKIYKKGWSFFNVYLLRELRDVYTLIGEYKMTNAKKLLPYALECIKCEDKSKDWSERKLLENINALKDVGVVDLNEVEIQDIGFSKIYNSPLSKNDKSIFREIFFSYFRFKEISSWFINPSMEFHENFETLEKQTIINSSKPIYFFSENNRFINTFLDSLDISLGNYKYYIQDEMSHLMRFWDVFVKWGITLNILEKFSLRRLQIKNQNNRDISVAYFIISFKKFNLKDFIKRKFDKRHIRIPMLIFEIALEYRYSIDSIKEFIVNEIENDDNLTYERTSQIFIIKGKNSKKKILEATYLYPVINNTYISHIIIRK